MISLRELADGAKRLQELSKRIEQVDLREEIVAQRELLLDAREAITELREENAALRAVAEGTREMKARKEALIELDGYLYTKSEDGQPKGMPFCPACIERGDGLFRLTQTHRAGRPVTCPNCKTDYMNVRTFGY